MRKHTLRFLISVVLIIIVIAGYFGLKLIDRYIPTKEKADVGQVFDVEGDQVALMLNYELETVRGHHESGQTYLPIGWVNEKLNDRFYWDTENKQLIYVLPTEVVYTDLEAKGSTGTPLILERDGDIYLSLGLVLNDTDIRILAFDEGETKRLYINNRWDPEEAAVVKVPGSVRVSGGVKSPVLTSLVKGQKVTVLDTLDQWSKVVTEDGYKGYVENKRLKGHYQEVVESTFEAPVYTRKALEEKVCLVWHQVTSMDANGNLESLIQNTRGVNVVSPTWFALTDNDGNYKSLASESYVQKAHSMGLQVWGLVDNFSDDVQSEVLLSSTANRKKLVDSLIGEALTYGMDGINLDFEGIKKEAGVHYVQFIREMSVACRNNGIILSVDNAVPAPYNEFYNRREQGIVVDYVIVMGYDEHYTGGDAGSVASIGFVEKGITDSLQVIPNEKLINGIPFYTRIWKEEEGETTSSALGIKKAKEWITQNRVELYWQEELGQYYGEIVSDNSRQMVWMEEERSLNLKMDLIQKYDLAGVGCWKLGLEPAEVWEVVEP